MEIAKTLKSALSTITGQLSKLKEELMDTNRQISAIDARIEDMYGMPINMQDYGEYLKASIKSRGDAFMPRLKYEMTNSNRGTAVHKESWRYYEDAKANGTWLIPFDPFRTVDSLDYMCFFFPEQVHERLMERIKEVLGNTWGNEKLPTLGERRQLVADLEAERTALVEKRTALEAEIGEISTALHS